MQATGTLRGARFSKGFILVVVAMLCALLLGAAGGYLARNGHQAAGSGAQAHQTVDAVQGGPQSDLTRALPTAAPSADPAAGYAIPDSGLIP